MALDPLEALGADVFRVVASNLDPQSLGRCLMVSTNWSEVCNSRSVWLAHCTELWSDKRYIPEDIKADTDSRRAFASSLKDCRRITITTTELCTFAWTFKFKNQALDHAVHGMSCEMIRYFQHDGSYIIGENDCAFQHPQYRWHFSTSMDGCPGLYIQINRFPRLSISRTPDWGWRLENPWVSFTSNPSTRHAGHIHAAAVS